LPGCGVRGRSKQRPYMEQVAHAKFPPAEN
jgi:hypothetical protein